MQHSKRNSSGLLVRDVLARKSNGVHRLSRRLLLSDDKFPSAAVCSRLLHDGDQADSVYGVSRGKVLSRIPRSTLEGDDRGVLLAPRNDLTDPVFGQLELHQREHPSNGLHRGTIRRRHQSLRQL